MTTPQIKPELLERLAEIAEEQNKDVNEVVEEMIDDYHSRMEALRKDIKQIIDENRELLDLLK